MLGAIALGKLGHSYFGWTGAVIGAPIGLIVGTVVGVLNENWAHHRQDMRYRKEQRRVYGEHFGQYWSPDRNDDWDKHVAAYLLGARMDGKFVEIVDGELIIDKITIRQLFGGMRGMKSMIWETSQLDPIDGIRFRGYSIPELREKLPKDNSTGSSL